MGCYEDDSNRSKISKLLRYVTTKSTGKEISLDRYLDNMPEKQDSIYYVSGESLEVMEKLPNLQIFRKKDIEVLLLNDHLDEPCIQKLADYEGKKFVSIQKADVKLDETEEEIKRFNKMKDLYKPLTDWWKDNLTKLTESGGMKSSGVKIDGVVLSKRLTESPVVVVTSQFGYSAHQEKIMRAQAFQNKDQIQMMAGRKTLEINGNHPVVFDLLQKVKENGEDQAAVEIAGTLFQTAMVESGYEISDPSDLATRIYRLMSQRLGVDPNEPVKDIELPEDEEEEEAADEETEEESNDEKAEEQAEDASEEKKKDEPVEKPEDGPTGLVTPAPVMTTTDGGWVLIIGDTEPGCCQKVRQYNLHKTDPWAELCFTDKGECTGTTQNYEKFGQIKTPQEWVDHCNPTHTALAGDKYRGKGVCLPDLELGYYKYCGLTDLNRARGDC